jgi:hypothetical protein
MMPWSPAPSASTGHRTALTVLDRSVDAGGDVARLLADRYRDAARVAVESGLARGVPDAVDDSAHDAGMST